MARGSEEQVSEREWGRAREERLSTSRAFRVPTPPRPDDPTLPLGMCQSRRSKCCVFSPWKDIKKCLFVADERPPEDQMILAKPSEPMSSSGSPTGVTWAAKLVGVPYGNYSRPTYLQSRDGLRENSVPSGAPVLHLRWNVSCG